MFLLNTKKTRKNCSSYFFYLYHSAPKALFYQGMIIIIRFNPVMRRKLECELAFYAAVIKSIFFRVIVEKIRVFYDKDTFSFAAKTQFYLFRFFVATIFKGLVCALKKDDEKHEEKTHIVINLRIMTYNKVIIHEHVIRFMFICFFSLVSSHSVIFLPLPSLPSSPLKTSNRRHSVKVKQCNRQQ